MIATETRTWDAIITFGSSVSVVNRETIAATPADWDLLSETKKAALREAVEYIEAGLADEAYVSIYKTTKARGREFDRSGGAAYRDGAVIRVAR